MGVCATCQKIDNVEFKKSDMDHRRSSSNIISQNNPISFVTPFGDVVSSQLEESNNDSHSNKKSSFNQEPMIPLLNAIQESNNIGYNMMQAPIEVNISNVNNIKRNNSISSTLNTNPNKHSINNEMTTIAMYGMPQYEPVITNPTLIQHIVAQPIVTQPIVSQIVVSQPLVTQPIISQPRQNENNETYAIQEYMKQLQQRNVHNFSSISLQEQEQTLFPIENLNINQKNKLEKLQRVVDSTDDDLSASDRENFRNKSYKNKQKKSKLQEEKKYYNNHILENNNNNNNTNEEDNETVKEYGSTAEPPKSIISNDESLFQNSYRHYSLNPQILSPSVSSQDEQNVDKYNILNQISSLDSTNGQHDGKNNIIYNEKISNNRNKNNTRSSLRYEEVNSWARDNDILNQQMDDMRKEMIRMQIQNKTNKPTL